MGIFGRKTLGTTLALLSACGTGQGVGRVTPEQTIPLEQLYVLESIGVPPDDTTITLDPTQRRVILIRRGAPDNTIFAILRFPLGSLARTGPGSPQVSLVPVPGRVGLDLRLTGIQIVNDSAEITFAYPVHFLAPRGAEARYGSALAYERALTIGYSLVLDGPNAQLLRSHRPGSDLLRSRIPADGRFLVVAPR